MLWSIHSLIEVLVLTELLRGDTPKIESLIGSSWKRLRTSPGHDGDICLTYLSGVLQSGIVAGAASPQTWLSLGEFELQHSPRLHALTL